jgi:hypothetical protein
MNITARIFAAVLASNLVVSVAAASGFYAGGEIGGSNFPDFKDSAYRTMVNYGYTTTTVSQNSGGGQAAIFAGQWLTDNFGWEANLVGLGSNKGKIAATSATMSPIFTSYQYSAGLASLSLMGGINVTAAGKIFLKAGAYDAGVTYDGPTSTITKNTAGPVLGGGFSYLVLKHMRVRIEAARYFRMRFPDFEFFIPANSYTRSNINTLAIGAAYVF